MSTNMIMLHIKSTGIKSNNMQANLSHPLKGQIITYLDGGPKPTLSYSVIIQLSN